MAGRAAAAAGEAAEATAHIPAALSPIEAGAARTRLLDALGAARSAGTALSVDLDGTPVLPCALQLLAALEKSAAAAGVELRLGPAAKAARADIRSPSQQESAAR